MIQLVFHSEIQKRESLLLKQNLKNKIFSLQRDEKERLVLNVLFLSFFFLKTEIQKEMKRKRRKKNDETSDGIAEEIEVWTQSKAHMELDRAARKGDLERYRALIHTSERFKHIDFSYQALLTEKHLNTCAQRGFDDLADYLISKRGADVNTVRGRDGFAPIHHAAVGGKMFFAYPLSLVRLPIITRSHRNHSCIVTSSCECECSRQRADDTTSFECDVRPC